MFKKKYMYSIMNNLCKKKKKFYKKSGSKIATIFKTNNNNIIRSVVKNKNKEKDIIHFLIKDLKNKDIKILFVDYLDIKNCGKYRYYLMTKYDQDITQKFLLLLSTKNKVNILNQILLALFYLNNSAKYYHNDLYFIKYIRNIMVTRLEKPKLITFNKFRLKCEDYVVKVIDFEYADKTPQFRTLEYQTKFFSENKIISELLLTVFFYCRTLKKSEDEILPILKKYSHIIENYLKSKNKLTNYNFDKLLLKYFNKIIKPLII